MVFTIRHLLVTTILILLSGMFKGASTQQCSPGARSASHMMLQGHTYKTMTVSFGFECLQACNGDVRCQSFNFVISESVCEFNDRTKEARPEDFVPDSDRYYFGRDWNRVPLGSIPELPAESCKEIKASEGGEAVSGKYWFDLKKQEEPVFIHCDMDIEDADECIAASPVCDLNATCQNLVGSYYCSCKAGFTGDGHSCTHVNECSSNPCLNNGTCIDGVNVFNCSCPPGYQGLRCEYQSCSIQSVGIPVTHHSRLYTYGAWMKDPLGVMGIDTIFVMENYRSNNVVEEFENMEKLKAGVKRKTYTLPYMWDGTGAVVYGSYLYYNRANTSYIDKYNLLTNSLEAQITLRGYTPRQVTYGWGGASGVDLAVDEEGLWVLWGNTGDSGRLYASKIIDNVINETYNLTQAEQMSTMGNAFVVCGVIYCIDSYNVNPTTINFAYDTKTGQHWNPNIQFTNQYGYNSMVDYNPRERVLYAWDKKQLVTYSLTWN